VAMPLSVRVASDQVSVSADCAEARQVTPDDMGRVIQWTLGVPQATWEVLYIFKHSNVDVSFGLGFGTKDVCKDDVIITEDAKLIVFDVHDGEVNVMGKDSLAQRLLLTEPEGPDAASESLKATYDAARGLVRFSVTSQRRHGRSVAEVVDESLQNLELYPTAAFACSTSTVRIEVCKSTAMMPMPRCERLLRSDFSMLLGIDGRSGAVTFEVEGREVCADRFLLAARSEYFERMLLTGMAEGTAAKVSIPRATHAAFSAVLRFLYSAGSCGDALFAEAEALEVLHLSVEFLLEDLTRLCEWRLMQNLSVERAVDTFGAIVAVRSKVPALAEACTESLEGRMHEVCSMPGFRELCRHEDAVRELFIALDKRNAKKRRLTCSG